MWVAGQPRNVVGLEAMALSELSPKHKPYWTGEYLCCSCGQWEFNSRRTGMGQDYGLEFRAHVMMNEDPLRWALMVANNQTKVKAP